MCATEMDTHLHTGIREIQASLGNTSTGVGGTEAGVPDRQVPRGGVGPGQDQREGDVVYPEKS